MIRKPHHLDYCRAIGLAVVGLMMLMMALAPLGCASEKPRRGFVPPPYTGPGFLRNTVESMAFVRNFEPLLVSGYGLVVNLEGTGSPGVPRHLRQHILTQAGKGQMGKIRSPEAVLNDLNTTVVVIEGLIPGGAVKGSRFDLLVTTLPQSQATSLVGGELYSTDLSIFGTNLSMDNLPRAQGRGPIYVNPFEDQSTRRDNENDTIQGVVIAGGVVMEDRVIDVYLRQPSFRIAGIVADRINERFPKREPRFADDPKADRYDTANALSDTHIQLRIPNRYRRDPAELVDMIRRLYLQRGYDFETKKVHELAAVLESQPRYARDVMLAWTALGRSAKAALRDYYQDAALHVRLSALEAGAKLGDEQTTKLLEQLARHADPKVRQRSAQILGNLPRSIRGPKVLHALVDDDDLQVRLTAYESLARINDQRLNRTEFTNAADLKFVLDLVPSQKPLIYITQTPMPRVVIFDQMLGFNTTGNMSMWDNRLMLRREGEHRMKVFYQRPGLPTQQPDIAPTVANLVMLMGHRPTPDHRMSGFDMHFGQVAGVLYTMSKQGWVDAPIELQINPGAQTLRNYRDRSRPDEPRPAIGDETDIISADQTPQTGG